MLFDGVRLCLETLAAGNIAIGVCSNKPHESCLTLLADLQISGLIDVIHGSVADEPKKPHPGPLLKTLEALNVASNQALYVGDSETDVATAKAAGVPVALVDYGYSATPVEQLGADFVLSTLQNLPGIWDEIRPSPRPVISPLRRSILP
jgi:phosphoglycolate phosphatase